MRRPASSLWCSWPESTGTLAITPYHHSAGAYTPFRRKLSANLEGLDLWFLLDEPQLEEKEGIATYIADNLASGMRLSPPRVP